MLIMNFKKYNNKAVNSYPVQLNQTFYSPHLKNMNVVSMYQFLSFSENLSDSQLSDPQLFLI